MNKTKVTVIIPTYNRTDSLQKAIKSAVNQSYENIQIIIVNDNDDQEISQQVRKIVMSFNDERICYIKNDKNLGAAKSRNAAINIAQGEYITFLDDDDIYNENKVFNQVNYMIQNNLDLTFTNINFADENGKLVEIRKRNFLTDFSYKGLIVANILHHLNGTSTYMFKREILLNLGGFPDVIIGEDYYLMVNSIESGYKIGLAPFYDVTATRHKRKGGLSTGKYKLQGEKLIFEFNKQYYKFMTKDQIKYCKMRYKLVIAYTLFRQRDIKFSAYLIGSFFTYPKGFFTEISKRIKR